MGKQHKHGKGTGPDNKAAEVSLDFEPVTFDWDPVEITWDPIEFEFDLTDIGPDFGPLNG